MWYARSPQDVAAFVGSGIAWANSNPQLRPEASPTPPLVLIEEWNEFSEGSYMLPTVGDGISYGAALGAMLQPTETRELTSTDAVFHSCKRTNRRQRRLYDQQAWPHADSCSE